MAAFKEHCAMGFWKARLLPDPDGILQIGESASATGNPGRVTDKKDLSSDRILAKYIKAAATMNEINVRAVATAVEWMSEGKPQNWRYMAKK